VVIIEVGGVDVVGKNCQTLRVSSRWSVKDGLIDYPEKELRRGRARFSGLSGSK